MTEPRPKRKKTGGRLPGTPNKRTRAIAEAIAETGLTPLEYMIKVMRDPSKELAVRLDAAKAAAPYIHPKLAAVEHSGPDGEALQAAPPSLVVNIGA